MEGLCLLVAALSAVAPRQGVAALAPAREQDGTPRDTLPTAPPEPTASPGTPTDNTSVTPAPGALRLAGGRSRCEGRVELEQEEGVWGTVCDDAWDLPDAHVVCRQLGCGRAVRAPGGAAFGRGSGPILRDEVGCEGHEQRLWQCPAAPEHDCSHKEDAGVVCSEHQEWRLTGGRDGCAGRVEVFFRGTWNTVCDSTWYELEGRVLCGALGCGAPLRQLAFAHTLPGKMLYQCESHQPSLAHCHWTYNKSAPCHQSRAVGVVCDGSLGLQTPTPVAEVTPSNVTLLSAEEDPPATGAPSALHTPLFILCLVLGALLLLTVLAFTAALLRVRKRSAHAVSSLGLPGTVLVTHNTQSPDLPLGTSNDYREMPTNLPKGPVATTKDSDSDSDYEHYDFSTKPPVALSTFHNSLRRQPREQLLPLMPPQDGMEPIPVEAPASLGTPSRGRASSSSTSSASSFSSAEPYCNDSASAPHAGLCSPPLANGTPWHTAPAAHSYSHHPGTATPRAPTPVLAHPPVPVSPADPDPADSSSTSSGSWYENVQREDPSPHPSEDPALVGQERGCPAPSCPSRGHEQDPDSSEGSDYDDIQGSAY